jgi:AAA+ superfamily predicted ATPase
MKCGTKLADDANFCGKCGTPTPNASASSEPDTSTPGKKPETVCLSAASADITIDETLGELNSLIGLKPAKDAVIKIANLLQAQNLCGETKPLNRHFVFVGNPGTGKTTVARIMGNVFKALKALPTNNLIEVDRSKLVGQYIGQTAMRVNEQCNNAMGGILFIDEAYALKQGQGDMFGQEALDTLLKRMENDRGKFVVIFSGYAKDMNEFLDSNSGFKSRFSDYIDFKDYDLVEMCQIFANMCESKNMEFATGFDEAVIKRMENLYSTRGASYANARTIRMLYDKTYANILSRVMAMKGMGEPEDVLRREIRIMRPEDLDMTIS